MKNIPRRRMRIEKGRRKRNARIYEAFKIMFDKAVEYAVRLGIPRSLFNQFNPPIFRW